MIEVKQVITKIWSRGMDEKTGDIAYRTEFIDTEKNEVFKGCKTKEDIKERYLSFWDMTTIGLEGRVHVDQVKIVDIPSEDGNWEIKTLK